MQQSIQQKIYTNFRQVVRPKRLLLVMMAAFFVCGGTMVLSSKAGAAPVLSATIDDNTTTGTNHFSYSGTWVNCGGCNATAYQNAFHYAYLTGDKAVFTFTGTQAKFYAFKESPGGIASVSIDGGTPVDADYYAASQVNANVFSTPVLSSGTHTVSFTVSGRMGKGTSPSINLDKAEVYTGGTSDTTSPTVSLTAPANGASYALGSTVSLSATASDDVGVRKVEFYVDGSLVTTDTATPYTASWNTTGASAGTHTITAKAYDAVGNSMTTSGTNTTLTNGATAPVLSATVDDNTTTGTNHFSYSGTWVNCGGCNAAAYQNGFHYAYITGDKATVSFTGIQAKLYGFKEAPGGIASVSVDGGAAIDVDYYNPTQVSSLLYTTPVLASGQHTVTVTVSGRKSSGTSPSINLDKAEVYTAGNVTFDPTSPTVSLTAPTSGASFAVGSAVNLAATATDNVGVTKVEFYVDGSLVTTDTATPYTASWNTTGGSVGTHALTAKAYDAAGHVTTASTVNVSLTNVTTTGTWMSGASGTGVADGTFGAWRGSSLPLAVTWSDNTLDNALNAYQFWPNGELANWTGSADWAMGGIWPGQTWAGAASGQYDAEWSQILTDVKTQWTSKNRGTLYIRFAHEMNGNWYPWSVAPGDVANFRTAWQRFYNLKQSIFPAAKLVFGTVGNSSYNYDWRTLWPGDSYVDVYSTDWYANHWVLGGTYDGAGGPQGLEQHRQFALAHGKPFAVSEWGSNSQVGDQPAYIQYMHDFFVANGGTGAGNLLYEGLFNVVETPNQFALFPDNITLAPNAAAKYKQLF